MKSIIAVLLATLALMAQAAHGWTFTWRNGNGKPTVESGTLFKGCTKINHAARRQFEWDRPSIGLGANCCINLYSNNNCAGSPQGLSCRDWKKTASVPLRSFSVNRCLGF